MLHHSLHLACSYMKVCVIFVKFDLFIKLYINKTLLSNYIFVFKLPNLCCYFSSLSLSVCIIQKLKTNRV